MPHEVRVPRLGWNMEEGVFVAWLKRDGEAVRAGEPLFTLEGDKSTQDVEATDSGVLRVAPDAPRPGAAVTVGTLLGYLAEPGEAAPERPRTWEEVMADVLAEGEPAESPAPPAPEPRSASAPVAVRTADRQKASPRARRVAAELGLDWKAVRGSGKGGRVRERDVRAVPTPAPVSATRQVIAARMLASLRTTAPVTLTTTADATNLVNIRTQLKAAQSPGQALPTYTDLVVKLTALALRGHPALNARWEEDRVVHADGIHIGIAVDTEAGLLVPVVRDVPDLPLRQLAERTRDLVERARARRLRAEEMQCGTFTVSNLGAYGVDAFTPIINLPECAILGVGRIHARPAVVGGQVVPRDELTLSLTFDHRIVDGAPAARFLGTVRTYLENPAAWLL
jgi:pyruvate dehydrogenase E2 component (dihydrolipoamide acetyltransferase)